MSREETVRRLKQAHFDILVIGGGSTGSGVALDAAARGLKVALVEKEDFGSGTSARSTKLIHGGVRYLEQAVLRLDRGQFNLVRDALRERAVILQNAPHLAWPLPLVIPLYRSLHVPYYWFGMKIYDALAGQANLGPSRFLSPAKTLERFPMLRPRGLLGGMLYYDGQFDDARLNVAIVLTASEYGAAIINHVAVTGLINEDGRISGVMVRGASGEGEWEIRAASVINAAGPFSDQMRKLDDPQAPPMLRVSSGTHIVLDGKFSSPGTGLLIPKTEDGRVLFILPWMSHTIIGTTDSYAEPTHNPPVRDEEIEYLLRHARTYFADPVNIDDVKAAWAGLRPLVADSSQGDSARLSRDHVITKSPSGLITIAGGKWTTYRKMAQDAVDHAVGVDTSAPSRTLRLPLVGAAKFDPKFAAVLQTTYGLDSDVASHLNRSYGDRAELVAKLAKDGLDTRLAAGHPYIEAEVVWAARVELAQTPLDVLARRTRIAFLDRAAAIEALPRVVGLLADELSWDADRRESEHEQALNRLEHAI
ncbi:MAG: FAD-dependent oxidoreductase [Anaerolineae bacterium]|nr:MAG: FAD-dependent oxidoreductase [Anaerolineae bacterium]